MYMLLVFLCLFKQKTAYEMRISDWRSDVCSSDLAFGGDAVVERGDRQHLRHDTPGDHQMRRLGGTDLRLGLRLGLFQCAAVLAEQVEIVGNTATDRKSVVSGKRVSVRVDLCGRPVN